MFCKECGKEMSEKAVACPNCGCATSNRLVRGSVDGVSSAVIILAYVFAVFFWPVGLALGIIGMSKGSDSQKGHGIAATVISVIFCVIGIAIVAQS